MNVGDPVDALLGVYDVGTLLEDGIGIHPGAPSRGGIDIQSRDVKLQ
jgi:hypothetical protein